MELRSVETRSHIIIRRTSRVYSLCVLHLLQHTGIMVGTKLCPLRSSILLHCRHPLHQINHHHMLCSNPRHMLYSNARRMLYLNPCHMMYSNPRHMLYSNPRHMLYLNRRHILYSNPHHMLYSNPRHMLYSDPRHMFIRILVTCYIIIHH